MIDKGLRISQHFTLGEFIAQDEAGFVRLDAWNRTKAITNMGKVAHQLEKLRAHIMEPIIITSGWRSAAHNRSIGGAVNSDHMSGEAVDFKVNEFTNRSLYEACLDLQSQGKMAFDQLIGYNHHVHIGMGIRMRGQAWITNAA